MTFFEISFIISGHENLLSLHKTTFEFTKDHHLTLKGDCIVGINASFDHDLIKPITAWKKALIVIEIEGIKEEIACDINPNFSSDHEIVVRTTSFLSERTLGINATKSSSQFDRKMIEKLKNPKSTARVRIIKI